MTGRYWATNGLFAAVRRSYRCRVSHVGAASSREGAEITRRGLRILTSGHILTPLPRLQPLAPSFIVLLRRTLATWRGRTHEFCD